MHPVPPLFAGMAYFLPNVASSTVRLYESEMRRTVDGDRFQMRHFGNEGQGDAIAWCRDDETVDLFERKGFADPHKIEEEDEWGNPLEVHADDFALNEGVIKIDMDSIEQAVDNYPLLSMLSGIPPEERGDVLARLADGQIYTEPKMRDGKPGEKPKGVRG